MIAGASTTLATLGLYLLLLNFIPYALAYTVAFIAGIVMAYLLNSVFVFRAATSVRTFALFPLIYVVQYLVGLAVVGIWVDVFTLPDTLAALVAVAVTVPITYAMARWLFVSRGPSADGGT
jgi:putative flippase GtrA